MRFQSLFELPAEVRPQQGSMHTCPAGGIDLGLVLETQVSDVPFVEPPWR